MPAHQTALRFGVSTIVFAATLAAAALAGGCSDDDDASAPAATVTEPTLTARAVLPAATFAAGPSSGKYLGATAINGQAAPFASQPVQESTRRRS